MTSPFARAGDLRAAYEAVDWSTSPLGDPAGWPPELRGALDLVLPSRFPVTLLWGPAYALVYNEAYVELIGDKHPWALGRGAQEVFPEAWDGIGPLMDRVTTRNEAEYVVDALVPLVRRGFHEDCWFTFCYSPVRGPDGAVLGIMDVATETSREVLARRRLQLLARLGDELLGVPRLADLRERMLAVLTSERADLLDVDLQEDGRLSSLPPAPTDLLDVEVGADDRPGALVWVPLRSAPGGGESVLAVRLHPNLAVDAAYLDFVRLIGDAVERTRQRLSASEAQRSLSEALQRSALGAPLVPQDLELAVRYQPASESAQIGGDWYDSFRHPDGSLLLVVGDVAGHDEAAATAMAQVRNLARGVAVSGSSDPAAVLTGLDTVLRHLALGVIATAVVVRLDTARGTGDEVLLAWSNAGHPPPALHRPGTQVELLEAEPDLLLGLGGDWQRGQHEVTVGPGACVVLYTDGLVERKDDGDGVGGGIHRLQAALTDVAGRPREPGAEGPAAEVVADHLLASVGADATRDDVALLVVRVPGG